MHMPKTGTRTAAARFRQNSPGRTLAPQTGTKIAPSRQHSPSRMHAYAQNRHRNSAVRIQTPAVQSGPHSQKSAPAQRGSGSAVGAKFPNEAPEHRGLDNTFRAACPKQAHGGAMRPCQTARLYLALVIGRLLAVPNFSINGCLPWVQGGEEQKT